MSNALNLGVSLPGEGYPSIYGFEIPVVSGLTGAYLFGEGLSMLGYNYAPGMPDASVIGTPTVGNGFASFGAAAYLQTAAEESANMTIFTVARASGSSGLAGLVGNFGSSLGIILYADLSLKYAIGNAQRSAEGGANLPEANLASFQIYGFRAPAAAGSLVKNYSRGASIVSANGAGRVVSTVGPLRVGRSYSGSPTQPNDQVLALIYNRALTDVEMDSVAAWARRYCVAKGIVA
nr:hypothetical protein [Pseudomonas juntendi]